MKTLEYRTDYSTVVAGWRSMVAGTYKGQTAAVRTQTGLWREKPGWVGASIPQMTGYVDDGYLVDGMTVKRGAYARPRRKMRFSEEGELQVDLALSGHDTPFLNWGKRTRQQGLTVDVELAVRAGTPAAVLRDY
ncbi:MAG TPA: hypothetical protein VK595_11755, partial [Vicinamibacterales bacterium]|nr:hypothetical protein [Vicinamibacterales bacterium]